MNRHGQRNTLHPYAIHISAQTDRQRNKKCKITWGRSEFPRTQWNVFGPSGWILATWSHILFHVISSMGNPFLFTKNQTPLSSVVSSLSARDLESLTEIWVTLRFIFSFLLTTVLGWSSGSGTLISVPKGGRDSLSLSKWERSMWT